MMGVDQVLDALHHVLDPELGINIVDLGLVYRVTVDGSRVDVVLMATSPACPLAGHLCSEAEAAIRRSVAHGAEVAVRVVLEPAWQPERMSAAAKAHLGWTG